MKRLPGLVLILALYTTPAWCQNWQLEFLTGIAGYNGDLTTGAITPQNIRPVVNANIKYRINDYLRVRAGVAWGWLAADDKYTGDSLLIMRNLSFRTSVLEASLCLEAALLDPNEFDAYPYVFAGVGGFRYKPWAYDYDHNKVFLRPLRTEGQGLPEYPDRKEYSLTQFCIPFGGGISFKLNARLNLAVEAGFRKLFTDHLDDVSNTYVDGHLLKETVGPKSAEMAYRGGEVGGTYDPFPPYGTPRGNPKKNDWYYFGGVKLTFNLGKITEEEKSEKKKKREFRPEVPKDNRGRYPVSL
jgi:hypothetical protein